MSNSDQKGFSLEYMSVPHFLENMEYYGCPPFESVRRTGQMIQEKHPELASSERVQAFRMERESEMLDFVRGGIDGGR